MKTITLFTFGYWGWGNATPQLVQAVDAVERSRGFKPPIFVDTRIRRAGRAVGFQGSKFEKLLGERRHRWMKSLGNKNIINRTGPGVRIADPAAANDLLDLAVESAEENRRVLYICGCEWPKWCHRAKIASLVLRAAKLRKIPVEIVEWPGGEPLQLDLKVSPDVFSRAWRAKGTISLGSSARLAQVAGLPWGSIVEVCSGPDMVRVICGPAKYQRHEWSLPVFWTYFDSDAPTSSIEKQAKKERRSLGLNGRSTG